MSSPLLALAAGIAALLGMARLERYRSGGDGRGAEAALTAGLLVFTALVGLSQRAGTPPSEAILAAAGGGLLLIAAIRILLRPTFRESIDGGHTARFFWVPLIVYLALIPWSSGSRPPNGDEPWYLLTAHSIAYDLDLDLANNYAHEDSRAFVGRAIEPQQFDPVGPAGQVYSRHSPLLPLILALPYRIAGLLGAQVLTALLTALLAYGFNSLARLYFPKLDREVALTSVFLALSPPLLFFSHQIWAEVPAALLTVGGLLAVSRIGFEQSRSARSDWLLLLVSIAMLPLLKPRFALVAAGLLLVAALDLRRQRKHLAGIFCGLLAAGLALTLFNKALLGNALGMHRLDELLIFQRSARQLLQGALGPFVDVGFGLFFFVPLWALLIPAILRLRGRVLRTTAFLCLPYLMLLASRQEWYGGFSPPFRYGLVLLPVLALSLIPLLKGRRRTSAQVIVYTLLGASVALTLLHIAVPGWSYNLADGRTLLLDHAGKALEQDVSRFFPSYTRPRAASWIWPPAMLLLLGFLWGRGRERDLRFGATWGTVVLLALVGLLPRGAQVLATQRVEVESPFVEKSGGHPEPERWVTDRTRFPESWVLREYEWLQAPIIPGGTELTVDARLRFIANHEGAVRLRLLDRESGETLSMVELSEHDVWRHHSLGPVAWKGSQTLRLEVTPVGEGGAAGVMNGVVLDRIDLNWR